MLLNLTTKHVSSLHVYYYDESTVQKLQKVLAQLITACRIIFTSMSFTPQDLHDASLNGTAQDVQRFIKEGADVNKRDSRHRLPLEHCVTEPKFLSLCKCKPDVDKSAATCVEDGVIRLDTTLLCSYCTKRLEKAKVLLENGTDLNSVDRCGWTVVHQCAWHGDLLLLRLCVQKGAKIDVKTQDHRLPVQLAATRGHMDVVRYLDAQSCDLKSLCRLAVNKAMGKKRYSQLNELPVPPRVKLFLNYNCTYPGFEATLVPPQPWTSEELHGGSVGVKQIQQFIRENASEEFIEENREVLGETCEEGQASGGGSGKADLAELIELFQSMYFWESFKTVQYEEPLARKPRYSMEKLEKEEDRDGDQPTSSNYGSVITSFVTNALSRFKIQ